MTTASKPWFSLGEPGTTNLRCGACRSVIDLGAPSVDHHPGACPSCGTESVFLAWKEVTVQVLPGAAPAEFSHALRWAQQNLDELEFVALLAAMAELIDGIQAGKELARP
jgi:hypothetical protein